MIFLCALAILTPYPELPAHHSFEVLTSYALCYYAAVNRCLSVGMPDFQKGNHRFVLLRRGVER